MTFANKLKRSGSLFGAVAFTFAFVAAAVPSQVNAYAGLGDRSIQMSTTANGATGTYKVSFDTVTTASVGSVVVEFCSNSPIIGDACTPPTGLNVNEGTVSFANQSGSIGAYNAAPNAATTDNRIVLEVATPASAAAGTQVVDLVGITNPTNANTTFYAKISTHAASNGTGAEIDAGGVALSTNNQLNLTAKVQETLTFCVYTEADCGAGGSTLTLGDANGVLLQTSQDYGDSAKFDLASNALSGVSVKLKGGLLTSGSNDITSSGTTCTADVTSTATEQFGFRVIEGGTHVPNAAYDCADDFHAFDTANTNTTYGQEIVTTPGASDSATSELEFTAKAAGTTEAGIYTSTLTLIATATY